MYKIDSMFNYYATVLQKEIDFILLPLLEGWIKYFFSHHVVLSIDGVCSVERTTLQLIYKEICTQKDYWI